MDKVVQDNKRILMVGSFPPPYGGVAVWNERIDRRLQQHFGGAYAAYTWNEKRFLRDKALGHININLVFLFVAGYMVLLVKRIVKLQDFFRLVKNFRQITDILRWVDSNRTREITFYAQHLAFTSLYLFLVKKHTGGSKLFIHER